MGWRDRDYARLSDDERQALWGGGGSRGSCAYCGRKVRGLPDARKSGGEWFCSQSHLLSYESSGHVASKARPRGAARTVRKVVKWLVVLAALAFAAAVVAAITGVGGHRHERKGRGHARPQARGEASQRARDTVRERLCRDPARILKPPLRQARPGGRPLVRHDRQGTAALRSHRNGRERPSSAHASAPRPRDPRRALKAWAAEGDAFGMTAREVAELAFESADSGW